LVSGNSFLFGGIEQTATQEEWYLLYVCEDGLAENYLIYLEAKSNDLDYSLQASLSLDAVVLELAHSYC